MQATILLFGGTAQGRLLSQKLIDRDIAHYYSTKTQTAYQSGANVEVLCGTMSAAHIAEFCSFHGIRNIIDAAHPFAELLHSEMSIASLSCGVPVLRLEREFCERVDHPLVHYMPTFSKIASEIQQLPLNIILAATGVNTITKLKSLWSDRKRKVFFRVLDSESSRQQAIAQGISSEFVLCLPPPVSVAHELQLIRELGAQVIISKETGTDGGLDYKISASIVVEIPIYILCRPEIPANFKVFHTIDQLIGALDC